MASKKILIVSYDFPPSWGGVATYSYEIANGLKSMGYDITVITGEAMEQRSDPFKVIRLPLPNYGMAATPWLSFKIYQLLKREQFDHIFCSLWLPDATAVWLAQKILKSKTPYSISVHAMEIVESNANLKKTIRKQLAPIKKKVFNNAKSILAVSQFSKNLLLNSLSLDAKKVSVINNGVNPKTFSLPLTTETRQQPFPTILTACRLVENKGVDRLINSLPYLKKQFPNISLRVCGDGPDKNRLETIAGQLNVNPNVHFLGKVPEGQLVTEFQQADLFCMLSRQTGPLVEGFGLVFLEAALCGTASLGGRSGGIPDAIEEGLTGWLVDPNDQDKINQKLESILEDPKELIRVGQQAQKITLKSKTWDTRIQKIIEVLEL